MADKRTKELTTQSVTSKADLTGLYLPVDKTGYTEDKKFDISSLIVDTGVVDGDTTDYKFITPKALKNTTATTSRAGVVALATTEEIQQSNGNGAINAGKALTLRSAYEEYWNEKLDKPTFYHMTNWGMGFKASYYSDGDDIWLNPTLPAGKLIGAGFISISYTASNSNFSGHFSWESQSTGPAQGIILSSYVHLLISSDRKNIQLMNNTGGTYIRTMIDINFTLQNE